MTLGRVLLAAIASPLTSIAGGLVLLFSAPARLWKMHKEGDLSATKAILGTVLAALVSLPIGAIVGIVFGFLSAIYGRRSPEKPFSLGPACNTRHSCPPSAEREAQNLKASSPELVYETTKLGMTHANVVRPRDATAKGVVIVQHGLHCHGGAPRSLRVAAHFARSGYVSYLPDAKGHGRSEGSWAVVESLEDLAADLAAFCSEVAELHPGLPLFIQGESMGGLLVLSSPLHMSPQTLDRLDGIVAVCPALMVADDAGDPLLEEFIRLWPLRLLKGLFPKFPATPGPKGNIFSSDEALNKAAQESIENDPLEYCGDTKFSTAMTFADALLTERNRAALVKKLQTVDKPLLLLHGTADKVRSKTPPPIQPPFPTLFLPARSLTSPLSHPPVR